MAGFRIKVESATLLYNKKALRQVMRVAGSEVAATARKLIRSSAGGGRTYRGPGGSAAKYRGGYRKGAFQASAPGNAPSNITGTLAKSIRVRPFKSGEGVAIRDSVFYALFLEAGAKGGGRVSRGGIRVKGGGGVGKARVMQARPFLSAALDARKSSLGPRIAASLSQDIKLVRMKA
ncbi:hypothetical protein HN018_06875 [Lichenicola cladoniae]|uniref:Uncharacterized protein n=1 Tax=Lichenicola cladoniae TaxID=1484109 RepID=A0A6M8HN06_9PROT|nr:hypothetical protein [Lichenicola cladoniae]NPD67296.1 hypothetical protein [Acetobacteraceae bacterium]QKE89799.1 hypothetical protein HN018_06875 [Lichenicola cladoniae]